MWLIANLKTMAAMVATALLAYGLHAMAASWAEARHQTEMAVQRNTLTASCNADKIKAKEANDALQKSTADIAGKLAAYKRLHPNTCIMPRAGQAQPAADWAGHAGADGISTDWLREFAATCETYRQQRLALEAVQ